MGKSIEDYVKNLVKDLKCDEKERLEIEEEFLDHLGMLKEEYKMEGFSETVAIEKAIESFGKESKIRKGMQDSLVPFYKFVHFGIWCLFLWYTYVLLSELLIKRILTDLRNIPLGDGHSNFMPYLRSDISIFDKYVFSLNTNFIPLKNISHYILNHNNFNLDIVLYNTLGQILAFLPLGIFLSLLLKQLKLLRKLQIIVVAASTIEISQYILKAGQFDVDDILLYTMGGLVGILLCNLISQILFSIGKLKEKLQYD
ncbi:VanZ family protein [Metabacillus niabensis]|uniref:VanZ family protein n=1 Tax=Metabacillus niabensis TaxID=324854 RepID=UPI001CFAEAD9|nr:VanZ family protein [Metabacillus niabensis]